MDSSLAGGLEYRQHPGQPTITAIDEITSIITGLYTYKEDVICALGSSFTEGP
jgi:hypothetical protein